MLKKQRKAKLKRIFSDPLIEHVDTILKKQWDRFVLEPHLYRQIMELDRICSRIHDVEFLVWSKATEKRGVFYLHTPLIPTQIANDYYCSVGFWPQETAGCFHRHPRGARKFSGFDDQLILYVYTVLAVLLESGQIRQAMFRDNKVSVTTGNKDSLGPCYHPGFRLDKGLLKAVVKSQSRDFYQIWISNCHMMTLKLNRQGQPKVIELPWITKCIEEYLAEGCFAVLMMDRHTILGRVPLLERSFLTLWEEVKGYLSCHFMLGKEYTLESTKIISIYPPKTSAFLAKYKCFL